MEITTSILENGVKLIVLDGRLDLPGVMGIELKFTASAASEKAGVVVDLSQVPFMASIGIRMLLSSAKAVQKRGGKLVLLNPQVKVFEMLTSAGISEIIPVYANLEAACADVVGVTH